MAKEIDKIEKLTKNILKSLKKNKLSNLDKRKAIFRVEAFLTNKIKTENNRAE